jgi:hypothetical protein
MLMACMKKDWMIDEQQCNALYEAPCPCPEADGVTCKSSEKCERNNWVGTPVAPASVEAAPEELDQVVWYDAVKTQIDKNVTMVPLATPLPSPDPSPLPSQAIPFPRSEIPNPNPTHHEDMPNNRHI